MILHTHTSPQKKISNCHKGSGELICYELLADYEKNSPGFKFIHKDILYPGDHIGEHIHHNDEEIYIIISGTGTMCIDGKNVKVGPGDINLTRSEHSHSLVNDGEEPIHFWVICTQIG